MATARLESDVDVAGRVGRRCEGALDARQLGVVVGVAAEPVVERLDGVDEVVRCAEGGARAVQLRMALLHVHVAIDSLAVRAAGFTGDGVTGPRLIAHVRMQCERGERADGRPEGSLRLSVRGRPQCIEWSRPGWPRCGASGGTAAAQRVRMMLVPDRGQRAGRWLSSLSLQLQKLTRRPACIPRPSPRALQPRSAQNKDAVPRR